MREESGSVPRISNFLRHIRTAESEYIPSSSTIKISEKSLETKSTGHFLSNLE